MEGYQGETKELNTQRMEDTYGVFTMEVLEGEDPCTQAPETHFDESRLYTRWQDMEVSSRRIPVPYRRALGLTLENPVYLK